MTITKPTEADLDGIISVLGAFHFHELTSRDGVPLDPGWGSASLSLCNEVTELALARSFVAIEEGRVLGFCNWRQVDATTAKTTLLSVPPEHRRRGIGKLLQEARMQEAFRAGCTSLETYCEHPDSQCWYIRHFGYRQAGVEAIGHRLYFFKTQGGVRWGIHYGFREFGEQLKLVCDLATFYP